MIRHAAVGMSKPLALVIGGSLGGLLAANLIRSVGWDALVFERKVEDLTSRGPGSAPMHSSSTSCGASASPSMNRWG